MEITDQEKQEALDRERVDADREDMFRRAKQIKKFIVDSGEFVEGNHALIGDEYLVSDKEARIYGGGNWIVIEGEYMVCKKQWYGW